MIILSVNTSRADKIIHNSTDHFSVFKHDYMLGQALPTGLAELSEPSSTPQGNHMGDWVCTGGGI